MDNNVSRRRLLKGMAYTSAVAAANAMLPGTAFAQRAELMDQDDQFQWKKTPCRFCGVGCGLLVGISHGKAVAVKGDPASPVNKGLCCVKGYHSVQALYGSDRLKKAMVRKNGKLEEVPIKEALDLVALKMQQTIKQHGKDSVSLYGSGQWTIPDGYVASKFMKAGIGTNNLEANARLCMASAVTGFLTSFGADEPMGCYDDIDHANVFILWGNNMAEMHPILFSRMLDRRLKDPSVKIISMETRTTRTGEAADKQILFLPQADLAIANAIAHELLKEDKVDKSFLDKHVSFKSGKTKIEGHATIGYGLEDGYKFTDEAKPSDLEAYRDFLDDYTPEAVAKYTGVSADDLRYLAHLYGSKKTKVMSLWCMGMNQHTRGTWINNLVYNLHLLTGKISTPGNSPFSLTGQPSACGTVREVGTLTHKLPHGVVMNKQHREHAAKIWGVDPDHIPSKPTYHTVDMFRALDSGDIRFMWIQVTNPMVTMPKLKRYREASQKEGRFIVVSDIYPTPTTDIADVILPSAMWIEREGMYGNSERRTQHFDQLVEPPGEAMSDTLQLMEVARRMGYNNLFPWDDENHIEEIYKEYCLHQAGSKHGMAPYEVLKSQAGAMWPYVNGKSTQWRFNSDYDPACKPGSGFDFYGNKDHKANIWLRPFQPAPEVPDNEYPFWLCTGRVLEHWHSGSMTRRIPTLHKSVPEAYVEMSRDDAKRMNILDGEEVRLVTRRGKMNFKVKIDGRGRPVDGQVFVPFFDENYLINELTLDSYCPISKQPDYKKCSVRIEKI
ncbi:molybdopterin-dependent oxidoreductase [Lentisphaera profundi]|uniref:Nitrate reductase n=1 Tax=Lentisphaera profundi TaxID=1658616 RepID=A0ABY7VPZ4_9BACT|nr:molybdopterin-dependent oxidoreductase [Lentisphaera profundi]WDE96243.1 molybdopterin-dependent oxidoreductase [Lentisphaera profundi]